MILGKKNKKDSQNESDFFNKRHIRGLKVVSKLVKDVLVAKKITTYKECSEMIIEMFMIEKRRYDRIHGKISRVEKDEKGMENIKRRVYEV